MIDRLTFDNLVKDALANLYDLTALESHALLPGVFRPPAGFSGSQGEYVRQLMVETIQQLRPERGQPSPAPEWRPYLLLQRRFVEGMALPDLAVSLSISDRQVRRDQHRALLALSTLLWQKLFPGQPVEPPLEDEQESGQLFEIHFEKIDLYDTLQGVGRILRQRLEEAGMAFLVEAPPAPVAARTDRVVLRQILISIFNGAVLSGARGPVTSRLRAEAARAVIEVDLPLPPRFEGVDEETRATLRYWASRIEARLEDRRLGTPAPRLLRRISLPRPRENTVLVVDDQGAAINLFRRLLAGSGLSVSGASQPAGALPLARQLRPVLIILDVMMPQMDGWEVLQTLKLDEETRDIPVLVCSAWEEPELSRTLGAAGFLKKPVTLKSLQEALKNLGL